MDVNFMWEAGLPCSASVKPTSVGLWADLTHQQAPTQSPHTYIELRMSEDALQLTESKLNSQQEVTGFSTEGQEHGD